MHRHPTDGNPFFHPDTHQLVQPGEWYPPIRGQAEPEVMVQKLDPADWPPQEILEEKNAGDLKLWATAQQIEYPPKITKTALLELIETLRPKLADVD